MNALGIVSLLNIVIGLRRQAGFCSSPLKIIEFCFPPISVVLQTLNAFWNGQNTVDSSKQRSNYKIDEVDGVLESHLEI